ncbi:MAG: hypothetical protein ACTTH8_05000 [Treponema sp.]
MKKSSCAVFSAMVLAILLSVSCKQNLENNKTLPQGLPDIPGTPETTTDISIDEVLSAFSLTKGEITASAAAKKIKTENHTNPAVTFTKKEVVAYDDKAGTFTVTVAGTKNARSFSNTLSAEGFTHPYNSPVVSKHTGDTLKLDKALEENLPLDSFIEILNNPHTTIADYLSLKFDLTNGKTIDFSNEEKPYKLSAQFEKKSGKIRVTPKYEVLYKTLVKGGTETKNYEQMTTATTVFNAVDYAYFTEADVFEYVAEHVKDEIIKADPNTFASALYAPAKYLNSSPSDLFAVGDGSKFKRYQKTYKKSDGHITITTGSGDSDLSYALYEPKNDGITADDYTGTITAKFYVQRSAVISEIQAGSYTGTAIKPISVKKSGFKQVSEDFLKKEFLFSLVYAGLDRNAAKTGWLQKSFTNTELLGTRSPEGFALKNKQFIEHKDGTVNHCYLSVNGGTSLADLAVENKQYVSIAKGRGKEYPLLITSIRMLKESGQEALNLDFYFKGKDTPITLTLIP